MAAVWVRPFVLNVSSDWRPTSVRRGDVLLPLQVSMCTIDVQCAARRTCQPTLTFRSDDLQQMVAGTGLPTLWPARQQALAEQQAASLLDWSLKDVKRTSLQRHTKEPAAPAHITKHWSSSRCQNRVAKRADMAADIKQKMAGMASRASLE
jgi:hypothetical protein